LESIEVSESKSMLKLMIVGISAVLLVAAAPGGADESTARDAGPSTKVVQPPAGNDLPPEVADRIAKSKEASQKLRMERWDANEDGVLSESELAAEKQQKKKRLAASNERRKASYEETQRRLKKYDVDGDGRLSDEERAVVRAASKSAASKKDEAPSD
jgi:hypothetical protein